MSGSPAPGRDGTAGSLVIACRAVLFDCDGVLVDSDQSVRRAWRRWAEMYGLPPEEVAVTVHGRRSADTVRLLIAEDRRAEAQEAIDRFEQEDAGSVRGIRGARALLTAMPRDAWAVVTSGVTPLARARLAAASLPGPPVLVAAGDVADGKPAPDGYLKASALLGVAAAETVVLEDSGAGVAAGRAAGAGTVVGVGERALETGADVVIDDLRGLTWTAGRLTLPRERLLRSGR
ncbi:HAD-IA family hydrolase [Sphaerisporangium corydalis]|uniref:HAD-IA family hydrolase n=1 Tax=Sphaerisporangium corydalis TaxID=1441875 RepID=A0ABV9E9E2_9ACTN|nr:HAD-IA family hydrolase [Sphaerisporangium corydalis]